MSRRRAARRWLSAAGIAIAAGLAAPGGATPGNAWFALTPAPASGDLDAAAYLSDPHGWPAQAATHRRGWAVTYRHRQPPPGWSRPFDIRGGGAAAQNGGLRPQFAAALAEMLPARSAAVLTLLDPPDSVACSPGKPNPHPFQRGDWLGVHDGRIGIEDATLRIWRADWGPAWEAFKLANPRDYHAKGDSTRGNAGEIYFLTFLYELSCSPEDVRGALERAVYRLWDLEATNHCQFNLLVQSAQGSWALRYAVAAAQDYPIFYGLTNSAEYWIADAVPAAALSWQELPNFTLASFPPAGPVELRGLWPCAIGEVEDRPGGYPVTTRPAAPQLALRGCPAVRGLRLDCRLPLGTRGRLELWDLAGRRLAAREVAGGATDLRWSLPAGLGAGVYIVALRVADTRVTRRALVIR